MAGENGGGAFVIIYIVCAFAIGVPILMAEVMIGRRGRKSPNLSTAVVAERDGASKRWGMLGGMIMLTAFLILLIYSVVSGWVLQYLFFSATGTVSVKLHPKLTHWGSVLSAI